MYRTVYVPVDNSEHSNRAIDVAVELGQRGGAKLIGSHVYAAKLHDYRFKQMEFTLPEEYLEENELERQRRIHDSLITMGLQLISDSYLDVMQQRCAETGLAFERKTLDGKHYKMLSEDIEAGNYDLVIIGALGMGAVKESLIGSVCERVVRRISTDTLIMRNTAPLGEQLAGGIVVGIDGSPQCFAGLLTALELGRLFEVPVEALSVYDPYLHYSMFNSIVGVLNEQASKVFRFKEQEQLHEEIIDTGLAKIYQSHLEIAQQMARELGAELKITLLDGKAYEKMLSYLRRQRPWLVVLGRYGVHRDGDSTELGSNTENLLRMAPCNLLLTARTHYPRIDLKADESIAWTEEAQQRMQRVPQLVQGIAKTAILRYAIEQGHSVITSKIIDTAMHAFMPEATARAMGTAAKTLAAVTVGNDASARSICTVCGYAAKEAKPRKCPVCGANAKKFQHLDRHVVQAIIDGEGGVEVEETFDGVKLKWTLEARAVLRSIEDTYQRRRAKARIEKRARVRKLGVISADFARPIVDENSEENGSRAPGAGERPAAAVGAEGAPVSAVAAESQFRWMEDARERLNRVPAGFMREMTKTKIEGLAADRGKTIITLELAEEAIGQARLAMDSMIGSYAAQEGRATMRSVARNAPDDESKAEEAASDGRSATIKSATGSRDVLRLNEVTAVPYQKPKDDAD